MGQLIMHIFVQVHFGGVKKIEENQPEFLRKHLRSWPETYRRNARINRTKLTILR